jgi:hypothetical protein
MKKGIFIFLILFIIVIITYKYVYKSHRNIQLENPHYVLKSSYLIDAFNSNAESSTQKYLDKTVLITGKVSSVNMTSIELDNSIICYFIDTNHVKDILSKEIKIKGRCIGFDELLEEIKFDQCVIIKY